MSISHCISVSKILLIKIYYICQNLLINLLEIFEKIKLLNSHNSDGKMCYLHKYKKYVFHTIMSRVIDMKHVI